MEKTNLPNSDRSVRKSNPDVGDLDTAEATDLTENIQTSHKSGKHSSAEKLAASRPNFGEGRGAQPVDGAFGKDELGEHPITGRLAGPGTNQFVCQSCGRYFNSESELSQHEIECQLAKAATSAGR